MKSTFQLLTDAFGEIKSRARFYVSLALIPAVLSAVAAFFEPAKALDGSYISTYAEQLPLFYVFLILSSIASVFLTIAATYSFEHKDLEPKALYAVALKFFIKYILLTIVTAIVILLGFLLLIVPGIWLSVSLAFASYFLVLRDTSSIVASMKKSHALVKGRWWRVFGKGLLFGIFLMLMYIPVLVATTFLASFIGETFAYMIETVIGIGFSLVALSFLYLLFRELENTHTTPVSTVVAEPAPSPTPAL
jgi:hypothetical protein